MIGRRGRPKKAPANPSGEFPNLSSIWQYATDVANRLLQEEYEGDEEYINAIEPEFEPLTDLIGNSMLDLIEYEQEIFRDTALGIIIAAKSQYYDFDSEISDFDVTLSIELSRQISMCIDEVTEFENKYKVDKCFVFDFERRYPFQKRMMDCLDSAVIESEE